MDVNSIAVFGSTGRSGRPFIEKAIEDYHIKTLVRDPGKLSLEHDHLEVIQGDVLDENDVKRTIEGTEAVISLIGPNSKQSPFDLLSRATQYYINAMQQHGVKRLISLTGGGVRDEQNDEPGFMDKMIVFIMKNLAGSGTKNALMDGRRHAEIIRKTNLDWTIVRGPMLTEDPPTGQYHVGYVGKVPGFKLSRGNLALFILDILKNDSHIKEMPFVVDRK